MSFLRLWCHGIIVLLTVISGGQVSAATKESIKADHVRISLLLPETFGSKATTVGVLFEPDEHWHVYWKNPGDSGAAPKFAFSGNADVGAIQWPAPVRMPIAHLTNLGYEGRVAYLFDIQPKEKNQAAIDSELKLEWLVCREECVPGFGSLKIQRPVVGEDAKWKPAPKKIVDEFFARVPHAIDVNTFLRFVSAKIEGETLVVTLTGFSTRPEVFPVQGEAFGPAEPQFNEAENGEGIFLLPLVAGAQIPKTLDLVVRSGFEVVEYKDMKLESSATPATGQVSDGAKASTDSLITVILLSFLGGVILNLMPCVFPVLSIKVFSILKDEIKSGERSKEALLYTLGVLVTFAALGAGFLALRAAGNAVGWGFQLQSPVVVLCLAILFWLMALNFLGAFEIGTSVMNVAGRTNSASSFATGVLSVFVAAPCTGPFMGSALGAAAVLPAYSAMAIFLSLGLGLAAPFLLIAFVPAVGRALPRPGAWMETFKEFLAFPLFATVLWLLWVLGQQVGTTAWQIGTLVLLGLSFGVWLSRSKRPTMKAFALLVAVASTFFGAKELRSTPLADSVSTKTSLWKAYDRSLISTAQSAKQAVFVDFTAAWCITCQVNKKAVLETEAAQAIFKKNNVLLIRADWTNQDPKITAALSEFGRNSVPVYAFYDANSGAPKILPQILTLSMIEELFPKP